MKTIILDGETLEGGGQLVRLAVCISALTGRPLRLVNIRGKRGGGGGLKGQHLSAITWLAKACEADVEGLVLAGRTLSFAPGRRRFPGICTEDTLQLEGQTLPTLATRIDQLTPGAVTLNLQSLLPFLLFAGCELQHEHEHEQEQAAGSSTSHPSPPTTTTVAHQMHDLTLTPSKPTPILLTLTGGTNVSSSPSIDYVSRVLLPNLATLGLPQVTLLTNNANPALRLKRGWSSRGRTDLGSATLLIHPLAHGATLTLQIPRRRGALTKIEASVLAGGDENLRYVSGCVSDALRRHFGGAREGEGGTEVEIGVVSGEDSGDVNRLHVLLVAHVECGLRLGADCLYMGKVGKSRAARAECADKLVARAVETLKGEVDRGGLVDRWMEDQMVVFQALARGRSLESAGLSSDTSSGEEWEASLHTRTVRWVSNELLGVEFDNQGACEGVGYIAGQGLPKK